MGRIDAHCHFWTPSRGDYGWLDAAGPALDPLRRDFLPAELARLNGGAEVIAVQAAPTEAETDYLLGLARRYPQIVGVVGWCDLSDADAAGRLAHMAENRKLRGLRPMLQDLPQDDWIATTPDPIAIAVMLNLGLRFDALVTPRHLTALLAFHDLYPDLPIVIDHAAKPYLASGADAGWAAAMAGLAQSGQVYCKISGLLTEMSPAQRATPDTALAVLRPLLARLLDWFGAGRLIWGSDWPVLTLVAAHADWLSLTEALLEGLSADERVGILGGNARRFYGLEGMHT